jgi:uncharacterized protein (DUF1778 family)
MSYATVAQLAEALEIRVTPENTPLLQDCLDAATTEIDHFLVDSCIVNPPRAILERTNVNRAVEWYKAPAAYNGGVGFADTGVLSAPASGFERHAAALLPLKTAWGIA